VVKLAKWADFVITKVRYSDDKQFIAKVEVREDLGNSVGSVYEEERIKVVENLKVGRSYCTTPTDKGTMRLLRGEMVGIVVIDGREFIRTDKNQTKRDNLGELPEF
jgi:hypothetical protein